MTNRATALSGLQKKSCDNSQGLFSSGSQLHWCSSRRDPCPTQPRPHSSCRGWAHCKHLSVTEHWIPLSCGYPALRAAQAVPHLLSTSLWETFLSISTFFRGFSGCQSAATTLRRKPPVGRMLISAGRQEGGAQLGSQSKSNQELTAPPALLPSCQEPGRACQEPPLHPPCAPSPSCNTTLPTERNRGHFPQSPLRHSHLPPELFYTLRCSFSLFRWL